MTSPSPDSDPLPIETLCTCRRCHNAFIGQRIDCLGVSITTKICGPCAEDMEREAQRRLEESSKRQAEFRKREREERWASICPKEFRTVTEGGNTDIARLEREQPLVKELLKWSPADGRGLVIRGATRKCKTRALYRLLRRFYVEDLRIRAMTAAQFDRQCRDAAGQFRLTEWFNDLAQCHIFALDDLGKAAWTQATEATWFDLVDERTREGRPIIITTNDTGETLATRMTDGRAEPLIRRLRDYCDTIVFK